MAFNAALAARIEKGGDRDVAPYFAGREREMSHFDDALVEADYKKKQTVFRVFQGAPGCGKTSLLNHLRQRWREEQGLLFVEVDSALENRAEVLAHVVDAALARPVRSRSLTDSARNALAKYSVGAVQSLGEIARVKNAGAALRGWQKDTALKDLTVVMTFDEAQNLSLRQVRTLAEMHKIGIGLPSVLLLAGLSHTYDVLSAPNAISRLVANAAMDMGAMTIEECAESTLAMLDELAPTGDPRECRALAQRVARISYGWPQHLNRAQEALCRELGRVHGDLGHVDFTHVEHDSDKARAGYYYNRLRDPAFDELEGLVHHIIGAVDKGDIRNKPDLRRACREQVAALNLDQDEDSNLNPSNMADALIRKGIVCRTEDRRYTVPIPSMVKWAEDQIRESTPSAKSS